MFKMVEEAPFIRSFQATGRKKRGKGENDVYEIV